MCSIICRPTAESFYYYFLYFRANTFSRAKENTWIPSNRKFSLWVLLKSLRMSIIQTATKLQLRSLISMVIDESSQTVYCEKTVSALPSMRDSNWSVYLGIFTPSQMWLNIQAFVIGLRGKIRKKNSSDRINCDVTSTPLPRSPSASSPSHMD